MLDCGPTSVLALRGLHGDVQTMLEDVDAKLRLRRIEDGPRFSADPRKVASLVSILLYGGRSRGGKPGYLVEPVICGLGPSGEPYLCAQDGLGAKLESSTFVVAGTAATSLSGWGKGAERSHTLEGSPYLSRLRFPTLVSQAHMVWTEVLISPQGLVR